MEDNGQCVLVSKKEYEQLKRKAAEPKSNDFHIYYHPNTYYSGFSMTDSYPCLVGTIKLGDSLYTQIRNIIQNIQDIERKNIVGMRSEVLNHCKRTFSNLSWFKRLFFNPEKFDI